MDPMKEALTRIQIFRNLAFATDCLVEDKASDMAIGSLYDLQSSCNPGASFEGVFGTARPGGEVHAYRSA